MKPLIKSTLLLLFLTIFFIGCEKNSPLELTASGIWKMGDTRIMEKFLNSNVIHKGHYGIEFRPENKKAFIQFIDDPKVYELKILKLDSQSYELIYQGKSRKFKLAKGDEELLAYWYFSDSNDYDPQTRWKRDGDNMLELYNNFQDFMKHLKEEHEFSEKEQELHMDATPVEVATSTK